MNTKEKPALADLYAIAFTVGCCIPNPGPGGCAFTIAMPDGSTVEYQRHDPAATNATMEMEALAACLTYLHPAQTAVIRMDSEFVVKGCNEWRHGWKAKGWRKSNRKPVENVEIWHRIDALLNARPLVRIEWVRGHNGTAGNERADKLAKQAARDWSLVDGLLRIDGSDK